MTEVLTVADRSDLAYAVRQRGTSDDWHTPPEFLVRVHAALGGRIDLDPFSSDDAQRTVQARRWFTPEDDAFQQPWDAWNVYMNPPYSSGLIGRCVDRFVGEYQRGAFERGIVLVNNATETRWFARLLDTASVMLILSKRLQFVNTDGKRVSQNTRGQCVFWFDPERRGRFMEPFHGEGRFMVRLGD